jgi:hypothetical protein
MKSPSIPTGPVHGDLLIGKDAVEENMYTLSAVPGPPQLRGLTYEQAVSTASSWALQRRVTVWLSEDGRTFTSLATKTAPGP